MQTNPARRKPDRARAEVVARHADGPFLPVGADLCVRPPVPGGHMGPHLRRWSSVVVRRARRPGGPRRAQWSRPTKSLPSWGEAKGRAHNVRPYAMKGLPLEVEVGLPHKMSQNSTPAGCNRTRPIGLPFSSAVLPWRSCSLPPQLDDLVS